MTRRVILQYIILEHMDSCQKVRKQDFGSLSFALFFLRCLSITSTFHPAPIKKGSVLETLAPLWFARYPPSTTRIDDETEASGRRRSDSFSSLESSISLNDAIASTPIDILLVVHEIDKLFSSPAEDTWDLIREKLHALKGDLLTMKSGSKILAVVGAINSFRDGHSEDKRLENWQVLREQVTSLASEYDTI